MSVFLEGDLRVASCADIRCAHYAICLPRVAVYYTAACQTLGLIDEV